VQHRELWAAAKLSVRAYARDPSAQNAADVGSAWRKIRQSESLTVWRRMTSQGAGRDAVFPYAGPRAGRTSGRALPMDGMRRTGT
jgi:hypothetical protein